MLAISNGRVAGVPFVAANSSGGPLKPELIILHDTAGRLEKGNSVGWFKSRECGTSAHFVVERDGSITQMVRTDRRAWHAGKSEWRGRQLCNSFSIGIEIVNPGKMDRAGRAWFGTIGAELEIEYAETPEHGAGWWLPYTPEQIAAVKDLCRAIVAEYPDCNDITTHYAVSPGRKIDVNPLFPLVAVRAFAFGDTELETIDAPPPAASVPEITGLGQSTTIQTAVATGATGTVSGATIISKAAAATAASGEISATTFLMALASDPEFWLGLGVIAISIWGASYIIAERARRFWTWGH